MQSKKKTPDTDANEEKKDGERPNSARRLIEKVESALAAEAQNAIVMSRVKEQTSSKHKNLKYIQKLFQMPRRERTKNQVATLIKYLRNVKVFKDLLLS